MTTMTLDYRGSLAADPERLAHLGALAEQFPVGSRIVHAGGRQGTVTLDQPFHVPGAFDGDPSAVCLAGPWRSEPMVFAAWDNEDELRWLAWVPVAKVRCVASPAVNRPANRAKVGGRR